MRRALALLVLAVVMAVPATAGGSPGDRTWHLVAARQKGRCALSVDPARADASRCDTSAELTSSGTVWFSASDGLPLRLDVTRPIYGTVTVHSGYLWGTLGSAGVGQAQLEVTVAGVAAEKEVVAGTFTSEPYPVTPDDMEYEVEFQIDPNEALAGKTLTEVRLGLEVTGPNVGHNLYYADGRSTLTLPLAAGGQRSRP